jgi:hypothetical protein
MRQRPLTIVLSGMIASDPWQGGATWAVLQYLLGLRRLGHRVIFVEPLPPESLSPTGAGLEATDSATYFHRVVTEFGLESSAALLRVGTQQTVGMTYEEVRRAAGRADVLINISGMLTDTDLTASIPVRVYLDLDPAFIQLWQAVSNIDMRLSGHTHFVTIGQSIGTPECPVPTCGQTWIPTPQPVVLDAWPAAGPVRRDALTTVGNWRGYGSAEYEGTFYGQKAHSLRPFFSLPLRTRERFELALAIHPDETSDLAALAENGWQLIDPSQVARTPEAYQTFIQESKAEFGIAKSGYVVSRCGWFSDRSLCYLASGRPVIAQETGFSRFLPTGEGLFAFETIEDVLAGIDSLNRDYTRHAKAARAIAEEFLDSDRVLTRLLEQIGALS